MDGKLKFLSNAEGAIQGTKKSQYSFCSLGEFMEDENVTSPYFKDYIEWCLMGYVILQSDTELFHIDPVICPSQSTEVRLMPSCRRVHRGPGAANWDSCVLKSYCTEKIRDFCIIPFNLKVSDKLGHTFSILEWGQYGPGPH